MARDEWGVPIQVGDQVLAVREGLIYEGKVTEINPDANEVKVAGDGFEEWFFDGQTSVQVPPTTDPRWAEGHFADCSPEV